MSSDLSFIACLRLGDVPNLLLNMTSYEESSCDFCGGAIWVPRKAMFMVEEGEVGKACTPCLGARLHVCQELFARPAAGPVG